MRYRLLIVILAQSLLTSGAEDALPWPTTVRDGAMLEEVFGDHRFFEGPTWDPQTERLYFTAFSPTSHQILCWHEPGKAHVWLEKTDGSHGTFLSNEGRLLVAQAYRHRIVSYVIGTNGPLEVATLLFDPTLHQPNDLCQTPRGDIYFTDPDFKLRKTSAVYRLSTQGQLTKVITDMALPNGLVTSPRGRILYVADSQRKLWKSYPILRDGSLGPGSVWFEPKVSEGSSDPDGMTVDEEGNVYATGMGGVWVIHPKGRLLGFIPVPEFCSNVAFGGNDGKSLFITCSQKVYRLQMRARGVLYGKRVWQIFQSAD